MRLRLKLTVAETQSWRVKAETQRGRLLNEYPLTMCGVDFNTDSLKETGITLTAALAPQGGAGERRRAAQQESDDKQR